MGYSFDAHVSAQDNIEAHLPCFCVRGRLQTNVVNVRVCEVVPGQRTLKSVTRFGTFGGGIKRRSEDVPGSRYCNVEFAWQVPPVGITPSTSDRI
jgi:hypothetical protein